MAAIDSSRKQQMNLSNSLQVATIGDINIDYVVDLSDLTDEAFSTRPDGCLFRSIETFVGGNGVFFAEAAREAGFAPSYLLTGVGMDTTKENVPDLAAQIALDSLKQTEIDPIFILDPTRKTGQVLILYQPNDRRFMVADRGANVGFEANALLSTAPSILEHIDLLYVSGYCLLDSAQRKEVQKLMNIARSYGTFVSVDIVPHNIFKSVDFDTYTTWTAQAHGVSIEASTMLGFLGFDTKSKLNVEHKRIITDKLLETYELCLIRLNSRSDFIFANHQEQKEPYIPYSPQVASLRFTDRVLANALFSYLTHNRSFSETEYWINRVIHLTSP